jgi:hypothetical protein
MAASQPMRPHALSPLSPISRLANKEIAQRLARGIVSVSLHHDAETTEAYAALEIGRALDAASARVRS